MREIPLSRGLVALVDDEDYDDLAAMGSWHAGGANPSTKYARKNVWVTRQKCVTILMHAHLTGWALTDHINGNGLDNQRCNLRLATTSQNIANSRIRTDNKTGFKGVREYRPGRFIAAVRTHGVTNYLGVFGSAEDAARAYDVAASVTFGEFARLNFPEELSA